MTLDAALRLAPTKDSDGYALPDEDMIDRMRGALRLLVEGDAKKAFEQALVAGYWLCADRDVVVGVPAIPGGGNALFAWRSEEVARPIILEAPHPRFDLGTGRQAVDLFDAVNARALLIAGTHRCANANESGCDGQSNACGNGGAYRESDMAHAYLSLFMGIHVFVTEEYPDDLVLSIHGMGDQGASVSNGTVLPTTSTAAVARFAEALRVAFPDEPITTCNLYEGAVVEQRLCGTTNVQGRHLNGMVIDACSETATTARGRFIHFEQSPTVRSSWERVADALEQVLFSDP